jgi:hypothetical protein
LTPAALVSFYGNIEGTGEAAMARHYEEPRRLGDLAERLWLIRVDCLRCGHHRLIRPQTLYSRHGPSHPWRWIRFRCRCGSHDVEIRAGSAINLEDGPLPLWQRPDLMAIIAEAVYVYMHYAGGAVPPVTRDQAEAVAEIVLRRLMAAGVTVSPPREDPPPPPPAA